MGAAGEDRVIIVSADCHIDPSSPEALGAYLEDRYQDAFADWLGQLGTYDMGPLFSEEYRAEKEALALAMVPADRRDDVLRRLRTGLSFTEDPEVRLRELEDDGVVAEVLFHNGQSAPFFRHQAETRERTIELQAAGIRAYNRWLADLCAAHPGRRVGVALVPAVHDVDETVALVRWAREAGLGGVMCPSPHPELPSLIDPYYEPVWAACAELDLPLHAHVGWGGKSVDRLDISPNANAAVRGVIRTEVPWLSRRALWLLTFAGVFERYPTLKFMVVEQGAGWIPSVLAQLDENYDSFEHHEIKQELPLSPSEYWRRQCYVGASMITRAEVEMRHQIGVDTIMFGTDYPHLESSWPTTKAWIQVALEGVPEADARAMLGENAIRAYGLDRAALAAAAQRVGPTVDEVVGGRDALSEDVFRWLEHRGVLAPASTH